MNKFHLEAETCTEHSCEQKLACKTQVRAGDQPEHGKESGITKISGVNSEHQDLESYSAKLAQINTKGGDGCENPSESAFEQSRKTLEREMENAINMFLKQFSVKDPEGSIPHFANYQEDDIQDHISSDQSPIPAQEIENCLDFLENHEVIKEYLQWVYDMAPQPLINDLILAVYMTIKTAKWNQNSGVSRVDLAQSIINSFGTCWSSLFKTLRIQLVPAMFGGYVIVGEPVYVNCLRVFIESTLNILKETSEQRTDRKYQDQTEFECSEQSEQRPSATRKGGKKIKKSQKQRKY